MGKMERSEGDENQDGNISRKNYISRKEDEKSSTRNALLRCQPFRLS